MLYASSTYSSTNLFSRCNRKRRILSTGTNLEDNLPLNISFYNKISRAVRTGLLEEGVVREMVKPLFYTRMRWGGMKGWAGRGETGWGRVGPVGVEWDGPDCEE